MSEKTSPQTHLRYGVEMVCKVWNFSRSSFYQSRRMSQKVKGKRGKRPTISDDELLKPIVHDIDDSHFQGEEHRKVHARLKRFKKFKVGRNRVATLNIRLLSKLKSCASAYACAYACPFPINFFVEPFWLESRIFA